MIEDIHETFEKLDTIEEQLQFKDIENPLHSKPLLHALLLIQKLDPGCSPLSGADHDVIFLGGNINTIAENATEQDILELIACGVHYPGEFDCLYKFV